MERRGRRFELVESEIDVVGQPGRVLGYSLFGVGTDIRKLYTREAAIAALRERLAAA